jgi:hypothetical protein
MSIYESQVLKYNKSDNTRPDPRSLVTFVIFQDLTLRSLVFFW